MVQVGTQSNFIYYYYYYLLFFNAFLSSIFLLNDFRINFFYYLFSLFVFLLILFKNSSNIIYFIRTFFLGIIGFIAMGAKLINESSLWGYHMKDSQTVEIATIMFLFTNIALFGSELGFGFAKKIKVNQLNTIENENKIFFNITWFFLLFVSILIDFSYGSYVLTGSGYAMNDETKFDTGIGVLPSIGNILFFILILLYFKFKKLNQYKCLKIYKIQIVLIGLYYFLFVNFLHGSRIDALSGLFGSLILYLIYSNRKIKLNLKYSVLGLLLFGMMQMIGTLRSVISNIDIYQMINLVYDSFRYLIENPNTGFVFYQGTINDIASTFSGIIYLLNNNIVEYLYGKSYFDYILRTPPSFIYPSRPENLALIFENNGYTSGGGFFELAEAYFNFSYIGVYIVPLLISLIIGYAYKNFTLNKYSIYSNLVLFGILASLLRGLLYQTFAFYKTIITVFILYFILLIVSYIIKIIYINIKKNRNLLEQNLKKEI